MPNKQWREIFINICCNVSHIFCHLPKMGKKRPCDYGVDGKESALLRAIWKPPAADTLPILLMLLTFSHNALDYYTIYQLNITSYIYVLLLPLLFSLLLPGRSTHSQK